MKREKGEFMRKVQIAGLFLTVLLSSAAAQGVDYGIAAKYPNDQGIGKDPDVLIFEDYELGHVDELRQKGWRW